MIGDSITGSYQNAVVAHFEGRADIYKNPGNAEHTGTGLKHIENWLELDTYLISGQEYVELVNGVNKTLDDMERYHPGYAGQPVELAGLVWFQGIADASSPRMAGEESEATEERCGRLGNVPIVCSPGLHKRRGHAVPCEVQRGHLNPYLMRKHPSNQKSAICHLSNRA